MLREQTQMDRGPDGMLVSPSTQYVGAQILPGKPCERIVIGSSTYGIRTGTLGEDVEKTILSAALPALERADHALSGSSCR